MNGGQALVSTLIGRGVDTAFFVAGGTYVTALHAISRNQNRFRAIPTRLESSATFAAEVYARFARKPAAVFVSRAPGACNAAIGVHTAMQSSRPMVLMIANIPRRQKGREAFQEVNYQLMYEPIAKAVFDVATTDKIGEVVARAVDLSMSGRPGPVVVVVSKDLLDEELDGDIHVPKPAAPLRSGPDPQSIAEAAALIDAAERPVLLGGEVANHQGATDAIERFAEASGCGVMMAYREQDLLANDHEASFGTLGLNLLPHQKEAFEGCDLLITVGTRLDSVSTGDYSLVRPDLKHVMIYPEPSAFSQWQPDVAIGSDCAPALDALATALKNKAPAARVAWRDDIHGKDVAFAQPGEIEIEGSVDMAVCIAQFIEMAPKDAILCQDAGTFGRWIQRYYRYNHRNTQAAPTSGAMGYGVPGALGAQVACPNQMVFSWAGDGGFTMTGHEVMVAVQENLPIKFIVCDNSGWGSILVHQNKKYGDDWDFGVRLSSPDFRMLGEGYGMAAFSVSKTDEFADALKGAMAHDGPALIHIHNDLRDVTPFSKSVR